jgi:hypothetical protein
MAMRKIITYSLASWITYKYFGGYFIAKEIPDDSYFPGADKIADE